jgi:hypothetical protein
VSTKQSPTEAEMRALSRLLDRLDNAATREWINTTLLKSLRIKAKTYTITETPK